MNTVPALELALLHGGSPPTEEAAPHQPANEPGQAHPLPPHACPEPGCDRRFNRKYTLAEHMKTHTGERPHVCPVRTCAKRFSTSGNLSRHKRLHGYIEPLPCPVEGCVCAFPSNNKLEKHMKFHYGSAVKVCPVIGCGKTFSTTGNLNRHLKHQHTAMEQRAKPPVIMAPPIVINRSPTSSESWAPAPTLIMPPPLVVPHQTFRIQPPPLWQEPPPPMVAPLFSPTKACVDMFEEVWNPEMLDTLVSVLHEPPVRFQGPPY